MKAIRPDTKKVFWKLGTCSRTFFYLLNREFGHPTEPEERAADPLAGGVMLKGHQCGMLWGASLAVGAEAFRRHDDRGRAACTAIAATQHLVRSFSERTGSIDCRAITQADFSRKLSLLKYMLFRARSCFNLAEKWAPEAIHAAVAGLSRERAELPPLPVSCASEVVRRMGASDEEMAMVVGFAGGLGLSGRACGALSAAIWMSTLTWCREQENPKKGAMTNPRAAKTLQRFYEATDSAILCHEIAGRRFSTIGDHADFLKNGGCNQLIDLLARS